MKATGDVVILGGGVIGLTTAYYLARQGVRVVVCDRGPAGKEASWAGAGILPPSDPDHARDPFDRLRALSANLFPSLSRDLKQLSGIDNGYWRPGGIAWLDTLGGADAGEWYGAGIIPQQLTSAELMELEPAVADDLGPAILIPGMAQIRNPRHLKALIAACLKTGLVEIHEDVDDLYLEVRSGRAKVTRTATGTILGDTVLIAAGAWTDWYLEPLGFQLGIKPVRGQIVLLNADMMRFTRVLVWGSQYIVPRLDGRVLVGSTEENSGFDKQTTAEAVHNLLALAIRLVPELAQASLEQCWAGLRPASPDGLPFIGQAPGVDNLFVAAGHFRAGIQLSPGTAWLLTELILGRRPSLPVEPYRLERRAGL
jgi:glycine oxidase